MKLFTSCDPDRYSDDRMKLLIINKLKPILKQYMNYHEKLSIRTKVKLKYKKLVIVRIFASDIWEEICKQYSTDTVYQNRINAIGKLFYRSLIATDENISMIKNGYGYAAIANIRLIIESIALAEYIWEQGEKEADRYQDFASIQYALLLGKELPKNILQKYEPGFEKDYGWMTKKKEYKSVPKLLDYLGEETLHDYYKLASHFVHASSYSVEMLSNQATDKTIKEEGYFPIPFDMIININTQVIGIMSELMLKWFMENYSKLYKWFLLYFVNGI
ncbi:MAG TPA: DUF5677 domain-containing protein [Bacteroidales bacterium]|nr:DUF5677 domain-containing protein [Bacteroidales bacterium]